MRFRLTPRSMTLTNVELLKVRILLEISRDFADVDETTAKNE